MVLVVLNNVREITDTRARLKVLSKEVLGCCCILEN
jgi:hypothetical protein